MPLNFLQKKVICSVVRTRYPALQTLLSPISSHVFIAAFSHFPIYLNGLENNAQNEAFAHFEQRLHFPQ